MTLNEKLKKIITSVSIACVIAAGLIAILYLVNCSADGKIIADSLSELLVKVLLTLLVIFLSGLFLLNAVDAISNKNLFGLISAGLIGVSAVLFLISIWSGLQGAYLNATVIIAAITILFNTLVGNTLSMGKNSLIIQIISYVALAVFEGMIVYAIVGGNSDFFMDNIFTILIIGIIWAVFAIILLFRKKALNSKGATATASIGNNKVVLTKQEYQALLDRIKELEEQLK
ncbi:MAG: hypothetical protein IKL82_01835 [Clostridia bacterium]|nr:hypothetical protein [Clostridia bacterium]